MPAQTRAQIQATAMLLVGETESPDADFLWHRFINIKADEIATRTMGFYTSYTEDIVSGQSVYCASQLLKVREAQVLDASGNVIILTETTPVDLDSYGSSWRRNPETGTPRYFLVRALNTVQLYPTPNYSTAAGITMEGEGVPGDSWEADTALCPLDIGLHDAVAFGAASLRKPGGPYERQYQRMINQAWHKKTTLLAGANRLSNAAIPSADNSYRAIS